MLGTRGCRLAILHPEICEMQVAAIVRAALAVRERTGSAPKLEIMIPLVAYEQELELMRGLVERVVASNGGGDLHLSVGTMIELPRACFVPTGSPRRPTSSPSAPTTSPRPPSASPATTWRASSSPATSTSRSSTAARSRRSTSPASAGWCAWGRGWGATARPDLGLGHVRRARGRSRLGRLLPPVGPRLRELLAVPGADRPRGRRAGGGARAIGCQRTTPKAGVGQAHGEARGIRSAGRS